MKKLTKTYVIVLLSALLMGFLTSCGPSQYYSYRSYVKHRGSSYSGVAYRSSYQKKLKHNSIPINKNYIIRNKQRPQSWR